MLGFILSTLAFSCVIQVIDRQLNRRGIGKTAKRTFVVIVIATLVSVGVGWIVDEVDGDADLPQKKVSFAEAMHSGDMQLIAGKIIGIY